MTPSTHSQEGPSEITPRPDLLAGIPDRLDLDQLGAVARHPSIGRAVSSARELLQMDLAYVTEFVGNDQILRVVDGESASFGVWTGSAIPLADTYCQRLLDGRLENPVADVKAQEESRTMPITEASNVGAFSSVPVVLTDGRFYGTLCCIDHQPQAALGSREVQILYLLARMIADQIERDELQSERQRLLAETAGVSALIAAVEARDSYTGEHSRFVVELVTRVAEAMDLPPHATSEVQQVALLHDIGKLAVPDSVLNNPGRLNEHEWDLMRQHPSIGARIVASLPDLAHLGSAIRAEHERWDGCGYPDGLAGRTIPVASRVVFVCDAYHAMTSDRPYRRALSSKQAMNEISEGAGTQFCPDCAQALLEVIGVVPAA